MIIVDSSVWIDFFRGIESIETQKLESLLGAEPIAMGDLILSEVLQGFKSDRDFKQAKKLLSNFECFSMVGEKTAIKSAENYRLLRSQGITIRKTIDCLIATFCIENNHSLLFSDKDFIPFANIFKMKFL